MKRTYKCAIEGFSHAEKSAFEGFFRMTANLGVAFEITRNPEDAEILIVNSDRSEAVAAFLQMGRQPKAMFIGDASPGPQWPHMTQPIRLTKVLQTLQRIAAGISSSTQGARAPNPASTVVPMLSPDISGGARAKTVEERPPAPSPAVVSRAKAALADANILVIDDSDIALKFMRNRLGTLGFVVDLVQSGEEAMVRVREQAYSIVFIDVMMDGMDGYQTCRMIKQRKYISGKPPIAVMLTSRGGTIDKIRGSIAGCDAYLTKPLSETELLKVLFKHGLLVDQIWRSSQSPDLMAHSVSPQDNKEAR